MQKNERYLLSAWINFYGQLFGFSNIYLVDDASDCEVTKKILTDAIDKGVNVSFLNNKGTYEKKGEIAWGIAQECFKNNYFLAHFSDVDEFLVLNIDGKPASDRNFILSKLEELIEREENIFRVDSSWLNVPHSTFGYLSPSKKLIIRHDAPKDLELDHGFHLHDFYNNNDYTFYGAIGESEFSLIHFHNRPYSIYSYYAREKLKRRLGAFSDEELKNFKGVGFHLAQNLLLDRHKYYSNIEASSKNRIDLLEVFGVHSLKVPFSCEDSYYKEDFDLSLPEVVLECSKPIIDFTKTQQLYSRVCSKQCDANPGCIELREDIGILIHPGHVTTSVEFDLRNLGGAFSLAAWIHNLPATALSDSLAGRAHFNIFIDGFLNASHHLDRHTNAIIEINTKNANFLRIDSMKCSTSNRCSWLFFGVKCTNET